MNYIYVPSNITIQVLQIINLIVILATLVLIWKWISKNKKYYLWLVPVVLVLLDGFAFSSNYLIDSMNGSINYTVISIWSQLLHVQDKLTIFTYVFFGTFQNVIKLPKLPLFKSKKVEVIK